ncbi:MAG: hypothetical protein PHI05_03575 [Bacilli bacterium]|nr:hypothetical protein [Bacilli bacterium]MDD4547801.1 hypothetical protein [Bacilli bacterium]
MILIKIDDLEFLRKMVNYFDYAKISYTTNINDDYDYLLVAEVNKKINNVVNLNVRNKKKIIFISYLEENNIYKYNQSLTKKGNIYNEYLNNILNNSCMVITSFPYYKELFKYKTTGKIMLINREIPIVSIKQKHKINKKECLFIDYKYEHISDLYKNALKHEYVNFVLLGYMPSYLLSKTKIKKLNNMPKNVTYIKYLNQNDYLLLLQRVNLIVNCDNNINNYDSLQYIFLLKKQVIIKNVAVYDNYLINSKNAYLFNNSKELEYRLGKLIKSEMSNLTTDTFILIKDNNFKKICAELGKLI